MSFEDRIEELLKLHGMKQADYGTEEDPYRNIRAAEEWGIPAWVGCMIRIDDKVRRCKRFNQRGWVANESVIDSLRDIAVYATIALDMLDGKDDLLAP